MIPLIDYFGPMAAIALVLLLYYDFQSLVAWRRRRKHAARQAGTQSNKAPDFTCLGGKEFGRPAGFNDQSCSS